MVKKLKSISEKKTSPAAGLLDSALAGSVKESAQQIWLAGMGAFSKAQAEGGKVFETLVKEGMSLQKKTQGIAEEKISEVTGKMSAMAGTVTAKAMAKMGVPTAKDVEALTKRVDALAATVAKLGKAPKAAATKTVAAKKAPAKKRVARKAAAA